MRRHATEVFVAAVVAGSMCLPVPANAQGASPLTGAWTLNRSLSELPREIGFNMDVSSASDGVSQGGGGRGGGRGRGGSGNSGSSRGGSFPMSRESYEDARRVQELTSEVRNPPERLTLVDTGAAVSITNELGQSRVFHPNGVQESIDLNGVPLPLTTRRDADRLSIVYAVEQNREIRYVFSPSANPPQLVVEVQFLDHGKGDKARLVYEPSVTKDTRAAPPAASPGGAQPARATRTLAASRN